MAQLVSHFEEIITQLQLRPMPPANTATAQATDGGHIESTDEFVRLADVKELLAPYSASRFKDLRCPICGRFVCGGC